MEITLNSNNITIGEGTITLNLSEGGGRQTLPDTWDDVTIRIFTIWNNGDIVYDDSTCYVPITIAIDAPASFQYNAQSVQIDVTGVPEEVTLSGISVTDGNITVNIPAGNITYDSNTITIDLVGAGLPDTWNNTIVTWITVWSNSVTASDTSTSLVTIKIDHTEPEGRLDFYNDPFDVYFDGCISNGVVIHDVVECYFNGIDSQTAGLTYDPGYESPGGSGIMLVEFPSEQMDVQVDTPAEFKFLFNLNGVIVGCISNIILIPR